MNLDASKETLRAFLAKYLREPVADDDQDLFVAGLINSLFAMQLVLFIEAHFSVKVEDADLEYDNFNTLNALARLVQRKTEYR